MEATIQKQPIVNGSVNKSLTIDEALSFNYDTKKQMCWNLIVSMGFAHSFDNIDSSVFEPVKGLPRYNELNEENIDSMLTSMFESFKDKQQELERKSHAYWVEQGREIAKAQSRLGFGGFLKMNYSKLIGYIIEGGSWNEFNTTKVSSMIRKIEESAPRTNYGVNNVNTGRKKHNWTTTGEYITLVYDYVSENEKDEIITFFDRVFKPEGEKAFADSIRYELTELQYNYYSVELILWWD